MESCDLCDYKYADELNKWRGRRTPYESGLHDGTCPVKVYHSQIFEFNGHMVCEKHRKELEETK